MTPTKRYLLLFLKGVGIGSVDIVPGVSGGTIALITGIYEELLGAIQSFDLAALRLLKQGKLGAFWQHVRGAFLLPLLLGIGFSLVTAVHLVTYLLHSYSIQTWSFFGGLIVLSSFTIYQRIGHWHLRRLLISLGGGLGAYALTQAPPVQMPSGSWFILLCGALAVCAMILPGISGSFVLLLLGKYAFMLNALKTFNVSVLATFCLGAVVGLLSFSRLISWLLRRYHDSTLALLAGFMLGSLNKVWPWKQALDPLGMADSCNLSPAQFQIVGQQDPLLLQAFFWMAVGMVLVMVVERQAGGKRHGKGGSTLPAKE